MFVPLLPDGCVRVGSEQKERGADRFATSDQLAGKCCVSHHLVAAVAEPAPEPSRSRCWQIERCVVSAPVLPVVVGELEAAVGVTSEGEWRAADVLAGVLRRGVGGAARE